MVAKVVILFTLCWYGASGSGLGHLVATPVVAATSSQYFARTFNQLVEAPTIVAPAFPPIVVAPIEHTITPVLRPAAKPTASFPPPRPTAPVAPLRPNIAVATAQALVQPLLLSAPIPIPSDVIVPQFQLLPLGNNGALNTADLRENVQKPTSTNTISSNFNFDSSFKSETMKTLTRTQNTNQLFLNTQELNGNVQNHESEQQLYQMKKQQHIYKEQQLYKQQQLLKAREEEIVRQQQQLAKQQQFFNQEVLLKQKQLAKQQHLVNQQELAKQQYLAKQQQLTKPQQSPVKTTVEIVQVPLAYIAPPPVRLTSPVKQFHTFVPSPPGIVSPSAQLRLTAPIKQVQTFVPSPARLVEAPARFRLTPPVRQFQAFVAAPARIVGPPAQLRLVPLRTQGRPTAYNTQTLGVNTPGILPRPRSRDVEPTTFKVPRFNAVTTPPRR